MELDMQRQLDGMARDPAVKLCCLEPVNLKIIEQAHDRVVLRCQVCQCRHFRVKPDGMQIFAGK